MCGGLNEDVWQTENGLKCPECRERWHGNHLGGNLPDHLGKTLSSLALDDQCRFVFDSRLATHSYFLLWGFLWNQHHAMTTRRSSGPRGENLRLEGPMCLSSDLEELLR
jgi:hypothetical protein